MSAKTVSNARDTACLPGLRSDLLIRGRLKREQELEQKHRQEQKKQDQEARQDKRREIRNKPWVRLSTSFANLLWVLFVSLVLTLAASYLVSHPETLESILRPLQRLLRTETAGASAGLISGGLQGQFLRRVYADAQLSVSQDFGLEYLDRQADITEVFGRRRDYANRGYRGQLGLERVELTPVVAVRSSIVDRVVTFEDLPTNDVAQLPAQQVFQLRTAEGLGSLGEVSLQAAHWEWLVTDRDPHGLPLAYTAFVTFRGEEKWLEQTAIRATAYYSGQADKLEIFATRGGEALPNTSPEPFTAPELDEIEIIESETFVEESTRIEPSFEAALLPATTLSSDEDKTSIIPLLLGITAAAASAAATGAVAIYWRRRKRDEDLPS
ncbi:MAG: hypothetical protein FWE51_03675 [Coriobacteriia bacterium]|nr:hypothetical protein [Coriobacteriia bacterium]